MQTPKETENQERQVTSAECFDLYLALRNTNDTLVRVRSLELNKLGIPGRQSAILNAIRRIEQEGRTPTASEIARWVIRRPHTVLDTLNRMEREGLIGKAEEPGRKNVRRIFITEKGQAHYERSATRESLCKMMSCLTEIERQLLKSLLHKLGREGLKELGLEQKIPWP